MGVGKSNKIKIAMPLQSPEVSVVWENNKMNDNDFVCFKMQWTDQTEWNMEHQQNTTNDKHTFLAMTVKGNPEKI